MLKIRSNIFETNSSSSHSLSLGNNPKDFIIDEKEFELMVGCGEYGWGYEKLKTWEDKANYLGIECFNNKDKKKMLKKAIKSKYPNAKVIFSDSGYIDHQSSGEIWSGLNSIQDVYNILFGDSIIIIDNDNH